MQRNTLIRTAILAALMAGVAGCVDDPGYGPYDDGGGYYDGYRDYQPYRPYRPYYRDRYYGDDYYSGPDYSYGRPPRAGWQDDRYYRKPPPSRNPVGRPPVRKPVASAPPRVPHTPAPQGEAHRPPHLATGADQTPLYPTKNYRR